MFLKKHPIDTCHICRQGWVVIVKEISSNKFLVYCNECEAEWTHPDSYFNMEKSTIFNIGKFAEPEDDEVSLIKWDKYINRELKNRVK